MPTASQPSQNIRTHVRLPLHLEPQPEGGWTITSPLVPEFLTEADTLADVMPNVLDAWEVVLEIYEDEARPLPAGLYPIDGTNEILTLDIPVPA